MEERQIAGTVPAGPQTVEDRGIAATGLDIDRRTLVIIGAIGLLVYAYLFLYFLEQRLYLIGSDSFYYLSMGDQFAMDGRLLDRTNEPALLPVTPQNGVALIYAALSALGVAPLLRMELVSGFHWLAWLSALYPFWRILDSLGVRGAAARGALILGFLVPWHIVFYLMLPNTDGLYNAGSIWVVWGLLALLWPGFVPSPSASPSPETAAEAETSGTGERSGTGGRTRTGRGAWWRTLGLLAVAAVALVHFRVNLFIPLIAAGLTVLVSRRPARRKLEDLAAVVVLGLAALASLLLVYRFVETATDPGLYFDFLDNVRRIGRTLSSFALYPLEGWAGRVFGWVAIAALGAAFVYAWRRRHEPMVFTLLVITGSIGFVLLAHAQTHRYMLSAFPLALAVGMALRWSRPLVYLLIALACVRTAYITSKPYAPLDSRDFSRYLAETDYRLPDDAVLTSQETRKTYVLLHGRHQRDLCGALTPEVRRVWVMGDARSQARADEALAACPGWESGAERVVTDGYEDASGFAVREVRRSAASGDASDNGSPVPPAS